MRFGEFEQFSFAGANGETVYGYVMKPWNAVPGQKYPVAFLVHGGPQGSFGNGWSYRWNPQVYAGAGYATVFIDFHGSTGYGQEFTDSISDDWGGKPLEDLKKGMDAAVKKFPWLDRERSCALGASYGGYMMNWIEGNWSDGFKCIVNHDGVFDTRGMAYSTEELWFTEWENGGTYFAVPDKLRALQPGAPRRQVEDADAGDPGREGLPHPDLAGAGRLHRAAAPGHREQAAGVPGREPLGAEAGQLGDVAPHGDRLARPAPEAEALSANERKARLNPGGLFFACRPGLPPA